MRVLVVGAGPSGSAAAITLARAGAEVQLVEKSSWPRAKTCGDGISPEAVRVAGTLGVDLGDRLKLAYGIMSAPSQRAFSGGWRPELPWGTIVERADFDDRLVRAAVAAGARFEPRTTVKAVVGGERGATVTLAAPDGASRDAEADVVLLAEGATGGLAVKAGLGRHRSRLVALRGYVRTAQDLEPAFGLHFDGAVNPGYGWIFPVEPRLANVGILVDERQAKAAGGDLRGVLERWLATPLARTALGEAPRVERLHGGVIPTGRTRRVNGPVLALGDAAGVADPFSAEGISQAMGTGIAAGQALIGAGGDPRRAAPAYARALRAFDANARASRRMRLVFPYVVEPLTGRALHRPKLAQHLSSEGFFRTQSTVEFLWRIVVNW